MNSKAYLSTYEERWCNFTVNVFDIDNEPTDLLMYIKFIDTHPDIVDTDIIYTRLDGYNHTGDFSFYFENKHVPWADVNITVDDGIYKVWVVVNITIINTNISMNTI